MTWFDDDTRPIEQSPGQFSATTSSNWNIGDNANGGYTTAMVLRAMAASNPHPDPISITTHFLRPIKGDLGVDIAVETIRTGRTVSTMRGDLVQDGTLRLTTLAAFGDLGAGDQSPEWTVAAPSIPRPDDCIHRDALNQGLDIGLMSRCEVRLHPDQIEPSPSKPAQVDGWIRFVDGEAPSVAALPLFCDAFPPSVFPRRGFSGWVPTIELTVHVRRRPAPGWIQARFVCDDLDSGRLIETGILWDSAGFVVARSRQIGLVLPS